MFSAGGNILVKCWLDLLCILVNDTCHIASSDRHIPLYPARNIPSIGTAKANSECFDPVPIAGYAFGHRGVGKTAMVNNPACLLSVSRCSVDECKVGCEHQTRNKEYLPPG